MHFIRFIRSLAPVDDRNDHDYCVVSADRCVCSFQKIKLMILLFFFIIFLPRDYAAFIGRSICMTKMRTRYIVSSVNLHP
jgi:hypothetical protein